MYLTAGVGAAGLAVSYAANPEPMQKSISTAKDDMDARIRFFTEPSREKLLPDQQAAYPGAPPTRTLVIDLDRTLVFSSYSRATGWRVAKRPGAEAFLAYMAQFYEIVVFTSNLNSYADPILDKLDPNVYVAHRLYRAETHYKNGVHIKDLSHLNRALERVVVIDRDEKQVAMHSENAIIIPEWSGDPNDTALLDLIPFLESLVKMDVADVRDEVAVLKGKSVAEGVAEHRALAAGRAEQSSRQSSLFGHGSEGGAAPTPAGDESEEGHKGMVWGTLSGSGIFHGRSQAAKDDE